MSKQVKRILCSLAAVGIALLGCNLGENISAATTETTKVPVIELLKDIPDELTNMKARLPVNPGPFAEMPPVVYTYTNAQGQKVVKHHIATGYTWALNVKSGKNVMADEDAYDFSSKRQDTNGVVTWQDTFTDASGKTTYPNIGLLNPSHETLWRRVYYGVMGGLLLKTPDGSKNAIVSFMHGENKNAVYDPLGAPKYVTNTVLPFPDEKDIPAEGTTPIPDDYSFDAVYFGFIGLTYSATDDMDGNNLMANDLGPIIWPSGAYLAADNTKLTLGVRHPYAIEKDGYIYLFYIEDQYVINKESGRHPGVKLARAPVDNYGPGNWKTYYNGGFTEDALPEGFDKTDRSFVYKMGGRSDPVVYSPAGSDIQRFTVAKLKGTDYYLGISWNRLQNICLHVSRDLIHWEDGPTLPSYGWSQLSYPQAYNSDISSMTEVDPDDFWILGTSTIGSGSPIIAGIKMSIRIKEVEKPDDNGGSNPGDDDDEDDVDTGNYTDQIIERYNINVNEVEDPDNPGKYINLNGIGKAQGEHGYRYVYYETPNGVLDYGSQKDMVFIEAAGRYRWTIPKTELGNKNAAIWDWRTFHTSPDYAAGLQFVAPKSGKYSFEYILCGGDAAANPNFDPGDGSDPLSLGDGGIVRILDKDGVDLAEPWDFDDWYRFYSGSKPTNEEGFNSAWRSVGRIIKFDKVLKKGETVTLVVLGKGNEQFDDLYFMSLIGRYATQEELDELDNPGDEGKPQLKPENVDKVTVLVKDVMNKAYTVNFGDAELVIGQGQLELSGFDASDTIVFEKEKAATQTIPSLKLESGKVIEGKALASYFFRIKVIHDNKETEISSFNGEVLLAINLDSHVKDKIKQNADWTKVSFAITRPSGVNAIPTAYDREATVISCLTNQLGTFSIWAAETELIGSAKTGEDSISAWMMAAGAISILIIMITAFYRHRERQKQ